MIALTAEGEAELKHFQLRPFNEVTRRNREHFIPNYAKGMEEAQAVCEQPCPRAVSWSRSASSRLGCERQPTEAYIARKARLCPQPLAPPVFSGEVQYASKLCILVQDPTEGWLMASGVRGDETGAEAGETALDLVGGKADRSIDNALMRAIGGESCPGRSSRAVRSTGI